MALGQIKYGFDDINAHGSALKMHAGLLEAEYHLILNDLNAVADFWGGTGSTAFNNFVTDLNRNFQVVFGQLDEHGGKVQTVSNTMEVAERGITHSWMA